jgi:HSP20 family molecular chaperone IbpA
MELPGVAEDDIDVSWSNGLLSVRGEKRQDSEEKSEDRHVTERRYGSFKRPVRLPEGVEEDGLSATFKKGVLHIDVADCNRRSAVASWRSVAPVNFENKYPNTFEAPNSWQASRC